MSRVFCFLACLPMALASWAWGQPLPERPPAPAPARAPTPAAPGAPAVPLVPTTPGEPVPAAPAAVATVRLEVAQQIERLADNNPEVRIDAVRRLSRLGPQAAEATGPLAALLVSNNPTLRLEATRALGLIGPGAARATDALVQRLADDVPQIRAYAAYALGQIGQPAVSAAGELVRLATADPDPAVRRTAQAAIQSMSPPREVIAPWIIRTMQEAEAREVVAALRTLATWGPEAIPVLRQALAHERAAYWAALVAAELGPQAADLAGPLAALLEHPDPEVRLQALMALGAIGPKARDATPTIAAILKGDPIQGVQYAAAYALGQIGASAEAYPILLAAFRAENDYLQVVSGWALLQQPRIEPQIAEQARAEIRAATRSNDLRLREIAVRMLAEMEADPESREEALAALAASLTDANPNVTAQVMEAYVNRGEAAVGYLIQDLAKPATRLAAIQALRRIGADAAPALPAFISMLRDPELEETIRIETHYAIGAMGAAATDAVPELIRALSSESQQVKYSAIYALGRIGPAAKDALPALEPFVSSESTFEQLASIWTMMRIQTGDAALAERAAPLLARALADERPHIRARAAAELGTLGVRARGYLDTLRQAAAGQPPQVQAVIEEAVRRIETTEP